MYILYNLLHTFSRVNRRVLRHIKQVSGMKQDIKSTAALNPKPLHELNFNSKPWGAKTFNSNSLLFLRVLEDSWLVRNSVKFCKFRHFCFCIISTFTCFQSVSTPQSIWFWQTHIQRSSNRVLSTNGYFSVPANKTSANRCRGASFDTSQVFIRSEFSSSLYRSRDMNLYWYGIQSNALFFVWNPLN